MIPQRIIPGYANTFIPIPLRCLWDVDITYFVLYIIRTEINEKSWPLAKQNLGPLINIKYPTFIIKY